MSAAEEPVIASVIAQVRPQDLDAVVATVSRQAGLEVHAQDPRGRLVVVLELANDAALAEAMKTIGAVPGVLGVNLVYHYTAATSGETPTAAFTEMRNA